MQKVSYLWSSIHDYNNIIMYETVQSVNEIHALRMWFKPNSYQSIHHSQHRSSPQRIRSTTLEIKRVDIRIYRLGRYGSDY